MYTLYHKFRNDTENMIVINDFPCAQYISKLQMYHGIRIPYILIIYFIIFAGL